MNTRIDRKPRLGILATHPIQYHAPLFRELAAREAVDVDVAFLEVPDPTRQGDGFGHAFQWDVPLRDGYLSRVLDTKRGWGSRFARLSLTDPDRILADWGVDAVLLTGWHQWPMLQSLFALRRLGIPILMRGESNAIRHRPLAIRWMHRRILGRIDRFLAIGTANREFYLRNGVRPEQIFDAPYFVDNAWFAQRASSLRQERDSLRDALLIPREATCVLFAGKLQGKKHPMHALDALEITRARSSGDVHLLVVGSGELESSLRDRARRADLPVTFAGFLNQSEMPRAYAAADVLVLPSDHGETWGLVVNEAMACGIPAIVSDQVGCAVDLVRDGDTGYVYGFGDVAGLARHIDAVASDRAATHAMGERARARVMDRFSVTRSADAVVAAVESVLGSKQ